MNLTDPKALEQFLARHKLSARKGLGQHFLCSESVVSAIVGELFGIKGVLEIGPGPGVLTGRISEAAEQVIALEIDADMAEALKESAPLARVLRADALKADLAALLRELPEPRAIVSNLPYYITAPLVAAIAAAGEEFDLAVLMMQREVASRFIAEPGNGDRGSISVYLQALFEIRHVADVPAESFLPPPQVDSTILAFRPLRVSHPMEFFEFVRRGFSQPRKTLANNLSMFGREKVENAIKLADLEPKVRAHELRLEQWQRLWGQLKI